MPTEENKRRQLSSPVLGLVCAAVWLVLSGGAVTWVVLAEASTGELSYQDEQAYPTDFPVPTTTRRTSTRTTTTTATTTTAAGPGSMRQVSHGGMSTEVPASWVDQQSRTGCLHQAGDSVGRFLRYGSCPLGAQGVRAEVQKMEQELRTTKRNYRGTALTDTTFRDAPAVQWDFSFTETDGTARTTTARFWQTGSSVHWLYLASPDSVLAESRSLFESMLAAARP
ncbi:hypothetical protein JOF53_004932 [Crossiella equi]|uniref:DUF1795 domain-containing protein n=1 Tax=Crossiella equi TaxID=130796 RepID=A0ABS5AHK6_9PSEU|nr:hypothetical protein [Crossiella equi]MBP2476060.1 hypothetical protein [Crossiella equi]